MGEQTWNDAIIKRTNWTKFTDIRTKLVQNLYEFHNASVFTQIHSREIRTKFLRLSYKFHVNFVQFVKKESKHTSKHTLQSHGHVIDHAPVFEHLGDRRAGAALTRCHSVLSRPGGATPDMAKWIPDSASPLSPCRP